MDPTLAEIFERYVNAVKPGNPARIANPLLRLQSSGFWHLRARPGRESFLAKIPANGGDDSKFLRENVEFVYLDDALYLLLLDEHSRKELAICLIEAWFPDRRAEVEAVLNTGQQEFKYEQETVRNPQQTGSSPPPEFSEKVRRAAFRRGVLDAYDHSCAATGDRFLMLGSLTLLEAAHIRPFSESYDDRIVNGMALSPGGDRKLMDLDGEKILIPRDKAFLPATEVLEWRLEKFREVDRQR